MHELSYRLMEDALTRLSHPKMLVLDVGSLDINGSFRALIEGKGWRYIGLDIVQGKNVDVVAEPFCYPFPDYCFDAVISGCTMEHITAIWEWVPELVRILKPGGLLVIETHTHFKEHRYPVDCWRVLPDGLRYLFDRTGGLEDYVIKTEATDIVGSAFKKEGARNIGCFLGSVQNVVPTFIYS